MTDTFTWRQNLRRVKFAGKEFIGASFRGVPFLVETSELSTGRRVAVHEFPLRDDPFVEDLGRRARKFRVDGYVIGDDYLVQRDALLDALEAAGPGKLVHPYYGERKAIGETTSVRETKADGGMAIFAIEFCETPQQAPTPTIAVDPTTQVGAAADAAQVAVQAEFAQAYNPVGLPSFALASAQTAVTVAAASLTARLGPVIADTQELAGLNSQLTILSASAAALVREPGTVITQFLTAIASLANTASSAPGALYTALVTSYSDTLGALAAATTATRARELANQLAITGALRRVMAIEAARLAPVVPYASIDDATAARDQVAGLLEEQAAGAGDTAYPALVDLRSKVLLAVPGGQQFARIVTVTRPVAVPSLLLAYQLYGSVDQEPDVVARNRIRHPGFITGELKVLSNG